MYFYQAIQSQVFRNLLVSFHSLRLQHRRNQKHAVGSCQRSFIELILIDNEFFTQHRQRSDGFDCRNVLQTA